MSKTKKNNKPSFYVVQFLEHPYEGIDDYVCVPKNWVEGHRDNQKAVVAYPENEDPLVTRDRVKRKEKCHGDWRYYVIYIRYESDTFNDADLWIDMKNNGPIVEEDSAAKDKEPMFPEDKKSRNRILNLSKSKKGKSARKNDNPRRPMPRISIKRPAISKMLIQFHEKRAKVDETSQSSMTAVYYGYKEPECSKNYQRIKMKDNQLMSNAQTEETASTSNGEQSTKPNQPDLSLPPNVDKSAGDATIVAEDYGQSQQSYQSNGTTQSQLFSNAAADINTAPKLLSANEQKSQPQIADLQSVAAVCNEHERRINDTFDNGASTSDHILNSLELTANPHRQMADTRRLVPVQQPVTMQSRPMNIDRKLTITTQNPSIFMYQNGSLSTSSVEDRSSVLTRNHSQGVSHEHLSFVQRLHTNLPGQEQYLPQTTRLQDIAQRSSEFQTNYQRTSSLAEHSFTESNNHDHRPNIQSIRIRSPQMQPQRPKIHVCNSQPYILQGVTKKTPPHIMSRDQNSIRQKLLTIHKNYLLNEHNSSSLATSPENIAESTKRKICNEIPTYSFNQSSRTQHTENEPQNLRMQKQSVDHTTDSNFWMEQEMESPPKVMDNTCQTDECMMENSLYHGVTYYPGAITDHEKISNHDLRTDEIHAEKINDYSTGIDTGNSSGDLPTSAQNSPSTSHQTDSRLVLEQQMLDIFASLLTQMGSTLRYTNDMYNTLRSSILDTAETYKNLLGAVERFNTASNVSTSSDVAPEVQQPAEEIPVQVMVTKKIHNNLWRFVLPPNYDRHDSRWTLKYRENMPGLVELMPQSGIYVGYGALKYFEQESEDCKSLAGLLLQEVFNIDALGVCSSMTEKAQAFNNVGYNVRPGLDEHANTTLLNFVIEHGLRCGWNTDLQPILNTLHKHIQEIRSKYGIKEKC